MSGLQKDDVVLEINGTKTNGLKSKEIANLITSAGREITFLVARKRQRSGTPTIGFVTDDAQIRQTASNITQRTIEEASNLVQQQQQLNQQAPVEAYGSRNASPALSSSRRLSRKDSAGQSSPRLLREEIVMNSSKIIPISSDAVSTSSLSQSSPTFISSSQPVQVC